MKLLLKIESVARVKYIKEQSKEPLGFGENRGRFTHFFSFTFFLVYFYFVMGLLKSFGLEGAYCDCDCNFSFSFF